MPGLKNADALSATHLQGNRVKREASEILSHIDAVIRAEPRPL